MELVSDSTSPRLSSRGVLICPDIAPFKSSVDGTVITGRRALREHNKRNDVTNPADFGTHWADKAKERAAMFTGDPKFDRQRRIEAVKKAVELNTRRR